MELIVLILATYRTAQVIAQEGVFEPLRAWVVKGGVPPEQLSPVRRWFGQLIHCVTCVSVWAGWALAALWLWGGQAGQWFVLALAASGGAVMAGSVLVAINRPKGGYDDHILPN